MNKLKSNDFKYLREHGKTFKTQNFLFVYKFSESDPGAESTEETLKFGFTITRKVGNAVLRNRLRRLLRESLRIYQSDEKNLFSNKVVLSLNIIALQKPPIKPLVYLDVYKQVQHFFTNRVFS